MKHSEPTPTKKAGKQSSSGQLDGKDWKPSRTPAKDSSSGQLDGASGFPLDKSNKSKAR